jgi:hypothetical protein
VMSAARSMRIPPGALVAAESWLIGGKNSLPAATKQEADEHSDSRSHTYCLPRLFA